MTKVLGKLMSRSTKVARKRPASGFYGVTKQRSNWNARINIIDGQQRLHCGSFGTKEEAALAYDRAAREHRPDLPTNYESIEAAEAAADRAKAEYMRQPKAPRKRPASGFSASFLLPSHAEGLDCIAMAWATRRSITGAGCCSRRRCCCCRCCCCCPCVLSFLSPDCEAVHSFPAWSFLLLMHLLSLPWWFSAIHIRARAQNCGARPAFAAENIH